MAAKNSPPQALVTIRCSSLVLIHHFAVFLLIILILGDLAVREEESGLLIEWVLSTSQDLKLVIAEQKNFVFLNQFLNLD